MPSQVRYGRRERVLASSVQTEWLYGSTCPLLIDHRQTLQLLPVGTDIEDKIVGTQISRARCRQRARPARSQSVAEAVFAALASHIAATGVYRDYPEQHNPAWGLSECTAHKSGAAED